MNIKACARAGASESAALESRTWLRGFRLLAGALWPGWGAGLTSGAAALPSSTSCRCAAAAAVALSPCDFDAAVFFLTTPPEAAGGVVVGVPLALRPVLALVAVFGLAADLACRPFGASSRTSGNDVQSCAKPAAATTVKKCVRAKIRPVGLVL